MWISSHRHFGSFRILQMLTCTSNCLMEQDGSHTLLDQVRFCFVFKLFPWNWKGNCFTFAYTLHAAMMAVLILLAFKSCKMIFQNTGQNRTGFQAGDVPSERTPLLLPKHDVSSWGSSYDSASYEEDDPEDSKAECSLEGKPVNEGENNNNNPRRLCIICVDATRECFFLPCGHCAACFTCGTR